MIYSAIIFRQAFWVVFMISETFEYFLDLKVIDWRKNLWIDGPTAIENKFFFNSWLSNYRQKNYDLYFHRTSLFESFSKVIDVICNGKSCKQDRFVPDPRNFDLPEDFIYIENEWGSSFYKHLGNLTRKDGKLNCSSFGSSVHLPIPRFREEFEFYKAHFGYTDSLNHIAIGLWP